METKDFKLMDEKLLAIVEFSNVNDKRFYLVDPSDIRSFLDHHSTKYLTSLPSIVFQSVLVYDPIAFQSQLDFLNDDSDSISNPLNN
jgi:hypothetical protein